METATKRVFKPTTILLVVVAGFASILASIIFYGNSNLPNNRDDETIIISNKTAGAIFHDLSSEQKDDVEDLARKQLRLIVSRPEFFASLGVVTKHEDFIRKKAKELNIPEEIALGMALLENGGSESAVSYAGAAGIFQITKGTAQTLGLSTSENNDERLDPLKNINAGLTYLSNNLKLFSDIGFAIWSYHAGGQNVSVALKTHLQSIGEKDAFDYLEAVEKDKLDRTKYVWKAYATKDGLNVHKVLENPLVKLQVLSTLGDETELYVYKVLAASTIYQTRNLYPNKDVFNKKVELFNQGRIVASDLLDPTRPVETQ